MDPPLVSEERNDFSGLVAMAPLGSLLFDPENPRLEDEDRGASQEELAALLDELYDAKEVAASIANFGYFPSEVLVGIPGPDGLTTIVEGNRRLAAAKGLAFPEFRARFSDPNEWDRLAALAARKGNIPTAVPVLIESDRSAVVALIGYRHISGIEPWEPYQQARYIADRVEHDALTLREVAELVGIPETQVRAKYRNFGIAKAAERAGADGALIQESFGIWDAAMGRVPIRQFIGAPDPAQVRVGEAMVPDEKRGNLGELVGWLFGPTKKIRESRDLGLLAEVIANSVGLAALRNGQTLLEAQQAIRSPRSARERVAQYLSAAASSVKGAVRIASIADEQDLEDIKTDAQIRQLRTEIEDQVAALNWEE